MFALRRVAVRAVQFQPTRQLSALRPITSSFQFPKPALYRSFHQSRKWLAEDEQKQESPAEATGGEIVTAEPSASEVKEESVATPDVADAAQEESTPAPAESAAQEASQEVEHAIDSTKEALSSVAETAQSTVAAAASQFPSPSSGAKPREPSKIIYIGNLFFEVTAPQLEAEFGRFGEVTNSRIVTDTNGRSKGFGFIEFANRDDADRAIRELDQKVFEGRRMSVQYHVPRERNKAQRNVNTKPSKTLFIGNMSYQMSDRDLNDLFRQIRNVLDVRVAIDRRSGQPRGFAHADFVDEASATKAKELLEQKVVYGRQLRVDYSTSTPASPAKDE